MSLSLQSLPKRLPAFAALAAAFIGAVNIASALTPNIRWRGHLLLEFEPVEAIRLFHALALPAGAALLLVAPYLAKRRRRALQTAVALMFALGVFDLLKGLDFEETILTWGVAAVLIAGRREFRVRHDRITLRSAVWRVPLLGLAGVAGAAVATWATQGHPSWRTVATETFDLLRWQRGPIHFHHHIPAGVHMLEFGTLLIIAYVIFRPLTASRSLPEPGGAGGGLEPRPSARHRHARVLQAPQPTSSTCSARTGGPSSATRSRTACCCSPGDPVGPEGRVCRSCWHEVRDLRRRARSEARRAGGQRGDLPAVRGARPADDLPR